MATRDPVLDELMRNGGRDDANIKKDTLGSSSMSLEVRGEDIGECSEGVNAIVLSPSC